MSRGNVKKWDRILAGILAILMMFAFIPVSSVQVLAATEEYPDHYTVTVTDGTNPISGAKVTLMGDSDCQGFEMEASTDENGIAAFETVDIVSNLSTTATEEYINFKVVTSKDGYENKEIEVTDVLASEGSSDNIDIVLDAKIIQTATLSVNVTGDAIVELDGVAQNSLTVEVGTEIPVKITPAEGSYIKTLNIQGVGTDVTKGKAYEEIIKVESNILIEALIVKECTITASSNKGGVILLNNENVSSKTVDAGSNISLHVKADSGYQIQSLTLQGSQIVEASGKNTYNVSLSISNDAEVKVEFVKVYTVTVTKDGEGSIEIIEPSTVGGSVTVKEGTDVKIKATPNANYRVLSVTINGNKENDVSGENDSGYEKTLNMNKDYTIVISFAPNSFSISSESTDNGTISIEKNSVDFNGKCAVVITPNNGYSVSSVKVNGIDVTEYDIDDSAIKFAIKNVKEGKKVTATFVPTEKAQIDYTTLFNVEDAVRSNGMTYIYKNDGIITFTTDKEGIKIYDKNGQVIGGGKDVKSVSVDETTEISKIELFYQADGELVIMPHEVDGISSNNILKFVIDNNEPVTKLTPEAPDSNEFYNDDFTVKLEVEEEIDYSGIATIEYFVTSTEIDGDYDEISDSLKTETGVLYTYANVIENKKTVNIPITAEKNNSDTVVIWTKVTDRAGNNSYAKTDVLKVCVTAPKLESVTINGEECEGAVDGYFNTGRTAIITIVDRESAFDENTAFNGIEIIATNALGDDVIISKPAMIKWNHDGDRHEATITFDTDANYEWSVDYTNRANLKLDKSSVIETGKSIYAFTTDTVAPSDVSISIDSENIWVDLIENITFGIWRNEDITASAIATDEISPIKEILYYKSNIDNALKVEELDSLYESGNFISEKYTVTEDEVFTIYARISDNAGNITYVSTNGLVVDKTASIIELTPDSPNVNGLYNSDVKIKVSVNEKNMEEYAGIKSIEYKVIKDNNESEPTQSEVLYTFDKEDAKQSDLEFSIEKEFIVRADKNNSDNVKVVVTAVDNAGNETVSEEINLAINIDVIRASITLDGNPNMTVADRGYFSMEDRTATIVITDRATAFNKNAATNGIVIKNGAGEIINTGFTISDWTSENDRHTAKITFSENDNYSWSFSYTNLADNSLNTSNINTSNSKNPFIFTVDNKNPTGSISVNENTWSKLLEVLTFGIYNNTEANVTAKYDDETSPVFLEYYKVSNNDATILLTKEDLDKLYREGKFENYTDFTVDSDEQFVVYLKITDYAGNYIYVSTDGIIVDSTESNISITFEEPSDTEKYNLNYVDGIEAEINVSDNEPYSGIKKIDYKVIMNGNDNNPTQSGTLFEFGNQSPNQNELVNAWNDTVIVDPNINDDCNIKLMIIVEDNAGNISTESETIDVDVSKPQIDISFNDIKENKVVDGRGYFSGKRTATVVITERTEHFDADKATEGITINGVDGAGNNIENSYEISEWNTEKANNPNNDKHTAVISFKKDANYTWSIDYVDEAGNQNETPNTLGQITPFTFTVDTVKPTGTVKIKTAEGREEKWDDIRDTLTFGIWSKESIEISGTCSDITSNPIDKFEYYKVKANNAVDGTAALSESDLDAITEWKAFTSLVLDEDEQAVIYIRITDLAGNCRYISTNGLIVDHNAPLEEKIAPIITLDPEQPINGIYNDDVKVELKVEDPMIGGTYSGLKKIWYEVKNMGETTQGSIEKPLYEFDKKDPKQEDLLQTWEGNIVIDSKKNNSNDVEIIIYAQDNALNGSDEKVSIKIDITPPKIDVSYDNNTADSNNFFKANRKATIVVTERNFSEEDIVVDITNTDGNAPKLTEWKKIKGTGNLDDTKWTSTISYNKDGDYTFSIEYTDLAGLTCGKKDVNYGESVAPKSFTIDKTMPTVEVTYDNNNARNKNYYKDERTATIVITEHNLEPNDADKDRVVISLKATDDGSKAAIPTVSAWRRNGDKHIATINYSKDAFYTFDIDIKDKAGNDSDDFTPQEFYVDKTEPTLKISGVENNSANKGDVIPIVSYFDTNYDADQVSITLTGAKRKNVKLDGAYSKIKNGQKFIFKNFAREESVDDIYNLTATLTDKAGNKTTENINFSVNRFGSIYSLDKETSSLNGEFIKEPIDVVITETNADKLSKIKITVFKDGEAILLSEGDDYKVNVTGGKGQWYKYTYTIFDDNFDGDGVYSIIVESSDKAGNKAKNDLDTKNMSINFGIDSNLPIVNIENVESQMTYALDNMTVEMNVKDNLKLTKVIAELDGNLFKEWEAEELEEIVKNGGNFTFDISGDSISAHNLVVYAIDAAGNGEIISETELPANAEAIEDFYVTTNLWVRYYTNKPLFFGSIIGVILLAGLIVFLVVYKKKKDEEE